MDFPSVDHDATPYLSTMSKMTTDMYFAQLHSKNSEGELVPMVLAVAAEDEDVRT